MYPPQALPSNPHTLPNAEAPDRPAPAPTPARWWREPLLHFVLVGAALFLADHALVAQRDDPRLIVIDADVDREVDAVFRAARGRDSDAAERAALRRAWLDNEVLYREGLSLGVDKGDTAIRERIIFKALSVVDANVRPPALDDKELRAWFEQRHDRYDEPARFDFQEAVLSGEAGESAVRAFAEALNRGTPGDAEAGLRVFKARPRPNLADGYGREFVEAFEKASTGEWRAWKTSAGWRAMRLDAVAPPRRASFEAIANLVRQDWIDATMAEQRTAAVRALARKYKVRYEGVTP